MNAVKYKSEQTVLENFDRILTERFSTDDPDYDFRTLIPTTFNPGWL